MGTAVIAYGFFCTGFMNLIFAFTMIGWGGGLPGVDKFNSVAQLIWDTGEALILLSLLFGLTLPLVGGLALICNRVWGKIVSLIGVWSSIICVLSLITIYLDWCISIHFFRLRDSLIFIFPAAVIGFGLFLIRKLKQI